jgi:hypothetical protein
MFHSTCAIEPGFPVLAKPQYGQANHLRLSLRHGKMR